MTFAIAVATFTAIAVLCWIAIRRARSRSIVDIPGRNRHFISLAPSLGLQSRSDDYFLQLEGTWKNRRVIVFPHNFEGPGSVTMLYVDTGIPAQERTWIEPVLSPGRALVEWRKGTVAGYEITGGAFFQNPEFAAALSSTNKLYPFAAITLPSRYLLSPLLMQSPGAWPNFVAILILDSGRHPSVQALSRALDHACALAETVRKLVVE